MPRRYGSSHWHLLGLLASFAVIAYAGAKLLGAADTASVITWFVAAIVLHDLVFLPLYSALDRLVLQRLGRRAVNHVRVPAVISGVLALVYFPSILRLNAAAYHGATSLSPDVYLWRFLAIVAALFAVSGLLAAWRLTRPYRRGSR
jgi:hypothetical protein